MEITDEQTAVPSPEAELQRRLSSKIMTRLGYISQAVLLTQDAGPMIHQGETEYFLAALSPKGRTSDVVRVGGKDLPTLPIKVVSARIAEEILKEEGLLEREGVEPNPSQYTSSGGSYLKFRNGTNHITIDPSWPNTPNFIIDVSRIPRGSVHRADDDDLAVTITER